MRSPHRLLAVALLCACAAHAPAAPTAPACPAPPAVTAEVTRLLTAAAEHATQSSNCVDGSGQRVAVEVVEICGVAAAGNARAFRARYRFTVQHEADTRGCGGPRDCPDMTPVTTAHEATLRFVPRAGGFAGGLPSALPGAEEIRMGPLDQEHDGDCYGKHAPFVPATIAIP